jgi:hypothetical protein
VKTPATEVGLVAQNTEQLNAVLAAVAMAGAEASPLIPQGQAGGCVACQQPLLSHFATDDSGRVRFVGCLKGTADTVYILVAAKVGKNGKRGPALHAKGVANDLQIVTPTSGTVGVERTERTEPRKQGRFARRAVYRPTKVNARVNPEKLELSDTRKKVFKVVQRAGRKGIRSKQILTRTKLPHGSVQQTLNWLRAHNLVEAASAADTGRAASA